MKNLFWGAVSQFSPIILYFIGAPYLLGVYGEVDFGLISYFFLAQSLFSLLELGFGSAIVRLVSGQDKARYGSRICLQLRSIEAILYLLAILGSILSYVILSYVLVSSIDKLLLILILSIASTRVPILAYRGFIQGIQDHKLLATTVVIFSLPKIIIPIILANLGYSVIYFFYVNIIISAIELIFYKFYFNKCLGNINFLFTLSLKSIKPIVGYSFSIAYGSLLWTVVSQGDRLLLSYYLEIGLFGLFSLVSSVAASVQYIASPFSQIMLPRWIALYARNNYEDLINGFRYFYKLYIVFLLAIIIFIANNTSELIFLWSGNEKLVDLSNNILLFMVIANSFSVIGSLVMNLQVASGRVRLYTLGSTISSTSQFVIAFISIAFFDLKTMVLAIMFFRGVWLLIWGEIIFKSILSKSLVSVLGGSWIFLAVYFIYVFFLYKIISIFIPFEDYKIINIMIYTLLIAAFLYIFNRNLLAEMRIHLAGIQS